MARNPKNPDIGEIVCPFTNEVAPVRRDRNGKLYYSGSAGMIKPNNPMGQEWMLNNANIWPHGRKPANDDNVPVTDENTSPAAKQPAKLVNVPVNGNSSQKPPQSAESKPDLFKWLVG
ncbi:hypothetical protein [Shewanella marina]|uniref:hypothetical protein n=1 Tax=Shewanella marina TaxID=487319 RepID=UPI000471DAA5|nr:hypothetical protein [Shewanella marina]